MSDLYLIKLSNVEKRQDFIKFMFNEVFPIEAIAKDDRVLRGGRLESLSLFGGSNKGNQNEFLLFVDGLMSLAFKMDQIKAFGAEVESMGDFDNDFSWTRQDKQT